VEAARAGNRQKRLWLKAGLVALAVFVLALGFSAYLRPDMAAVFGDIMAFCATLLK
jgi:uncharacterized membrane-anchored protein